MLAQFFARVSDAEEVGRSSFLPPGGRMSRRRDGARRVEEIWGVAPEFDSSRLVLSPEEGFLLSRIDGVTPWGLIVEMAGMEARRAESCLEDWRVKGLVQRVAGADSNPASLDAASSSPADAQGSACIIDPSLIDPSLEIDVETQRKILEFEARQGGGYHARLGVEPGAELKTIKKAYFKLSREFHPDRFFRCDLGPYSERLPLVFKTILEAYDALLRDCPTDSGNTGKSIGNCESNPAGGGSGAEKSEAGARSGFEKITRLGQRTLQNVPRSVRDERHQKAEEFFEAGRVSEREGRLEEASTSFRLAIRFEPENLAYRAAFKELKSRKEKLSVHDVLGVSESYTSMNPGELGRTMAALEERLCVHPQDPELSHRAACVALALNRSQRATSLAGIATEQSPQVAQYHTTLGRAHLAQGHVGHAKHEFERALECDPQDTDARGELANLLHAGRESHGGFSRG
jgi:curved DNA-binding protein CbpA